MATRDDDTRRRVVSLFKTVWKMANIGGKLLKVTDAAREPRPSDRHSWWPSGRLVLVRERRTWHLSRLRAANSSATRRNGRTGNHLSDMRCAAARAPLGDRVCDEPLGHSLDLEPVDRHEALLRLGVNPSNHFDVGLEPRALQLRLQQAVDLVDA